MLRERERFFGDLTYELEYDWIVILICLVDSLTEDDGTKIWATLRYERLPDFCYYCGILGHGDRECLKLLEITESGAAKPTLQYRPFLRAEVKKKGGFNLGSTNKNLQNREGSAAARTSPPVLEKMTGNRPAKIDLAMIPPSAGIEMLGTSLGGRKTHLGSDPSPQRPSASLLNQSSRSGEKNSGFEMLATSSGFPTAPVQADEAPRRSPGISGFPSASVQAVEVQAVELQAVDTVVQVVEVQAETRLKCRCLCRQLTRLTKQAARRSLGSGGFSPAIAQADDVEAARKSRGSGAFPSAYAQEDDGVFHALNNAIPASVSASDVSAEIKTQLKKIP